MAGKRNKRTGLILVATTLTCALGIWLLTPSVRQENVSEYACNVYAHPCRIGDYTRGECKLILIEDSGRCQFYRTHPDCIAACTCFRGVAQQTKLVRCGPDKKGMCYNGGCVMPSHSVLFY